MSARVWAACRRLGPAALGLLFAAGVLAAPVLTVRWQEARLLAGPQPRQSAGSLFWAPAVQQNPFLYALHRACLLGELAGPVGRSGTPQPPDTQAELLGTALEKLGELHAAGLLDADTLAECRLALETAAPGQPAEAEADRPFSGSAVDSELFCTAADSGVQGLSMTLFVADLSQTGAELQALLAADGLQSGWFSLDLQWLREDGHVVYCGIWPFGEMPAAPDMQAWERYLGLDGFDDWRAMGVEEFSSAYPLLPNIGPHLLSAQAGVALMAVGSEEGFSLRCSSLLGQ